MKGKSLGFKIEIHDHDNIWTTYQEDIAKEPIYTFDEALEYAKKLFLEGYVVRINEVFQSIETVVTFGTAKDSKNDS